MTTESATRTRWLTATAMLLGLAVVLRVRVGWLPLGDNALTRMWTDAVGGAHTPLVGGDSRFGWNHLGPWLFYIFAIPYRLLGASPRGLLIGAGVINIASVVVIGRCVRSLAGEWASAVVCTATMVYVLTARGPRLIDPWNPYVVELVFVAAVVTCWAVVAGDMKWLPWLIGAASLATQAHIAFLPPCVALVAIAVVAMVVRRVRPPRRIVVQTAIVSGFAWIPALVDLVLPAHHNLFRIGRFFLASSPSGSRGGLGAGLRVLLRETGAGGGWLGGRPGLSTFTQAFDGRVGPAAGLGLILMVGGGIMAWRKHNTVAGMLAIILSVLAFVAVAEMSAARGPLFPYLFGWVTMLGMLCWLVPLLALSGMRFAPRAFPITRAACLTAAVLIVAASIRANPPRSPLEQHSDAAVVARLVAQARLGLHPSGHYRLAHGTDLFNSIYELGVVSELRSDGYQIVVDPNAVVLFGQHMTDSRADSYPTLKIVAPFYGARSGERLLAVSDPLSPLDRSKERSLTSALSSTYRVAGFANAASLVTSDASDTAGLAGFVDPDHHLAAMLGQLTMLRAEGRPVAIVLVDNPSPPHP